MLQQPTLTIDALRQNYRTRFAMAQKLGLAEWFKAEFGSEKKWLSQFEGRQYDSEEAV